jgi:hypothetical protein
MILAGRWLQIRDCGDVDWAEGSLAQNWAPAPAAGQRPLASGKFSAAMLGRVRALLDQRCSGTCQRWGEEDVTGPHRTAPK